MYIWDMTRVASNEHVHNLFKKPYKMVYMYMYVHNVALRCFHSVTWPCSLSIVIFGLFPTSSCVQALADYAHNPLYYAIPENWVIMLPLWATLYHAYVMLSYILTWNKWLQCLLWMWLVRELHTVRDRGATAIILCKNGGSYMYTRAQSSLTLFLQYWVKPPLNSLAFHLHEYNCAHTHVHLHCGNITIYMHLFLKN